MAPAGAAGSRSGGRVISGGLQRRRGGSKGGAATAIPILYSEKFFMSTLNDVESRWLCVTVRQRPRPLRNAGLRNLFAHYPSGAWVDILPDHAHTQVICLPKRPENGWSCC